MLQELYKYAQDKGLAARPGFKEKNVKWYISFSADGSFIGIDPALEKTYCPDIGGATQGDKCNIIAEKASIIFLLIDSSNSTKYSKKHDFYFESMKKAAEYDSMFAIAINGLSEQFETIKASYLSDKKHSPIDVVSMKVDGKPLEKSLDYLDWWETYRKSFISTNSNKELVRSFITGELSCPVERVPRFTGLSQVGGKSESILICYDKKEYSSYGLQYATNASVTEETMSVVNSALNELLKDENSSTLAGAKYIHWYKETPSVDIFEALDLTLSLNIDDETDVSDDEKNNDEDIRRIKKMYKYIFDGKSLEKPSNHYYMMALSGNEFRVMVRSFDEGSYDDLYYNITQWYNDLSLIRANGKGEGSFPKLFTINTRLIKYSSDKTKLTDRIKDELSGLEPRIMYAITHNTPLPDSVAARALAYIRSDMYSSSQEDGSSKKKQIDRTSCQILKAWLNRKYKNLNKEEFTIMADINKESPSKAYQTGRLMAVYARIQAAALGDINAGVVEKYYTSACTSPALVIGKLATMSQYHLSKIESKGLVVYFNRMLEEITEKLGCSIPTTFSMTEQAEFALGYYHQNAEMSRKKNDNNVDDNKED